MTRTKIGRTALPSAALLLAMAGTAFGQQAVTLDQGWDEATRNLFYHEPQGSPIMPYAWFLALEQTGSEALFRDDSHLESFGMIAWGTSALNPDALPIGLTIDKGMLGPEPQLGMNCAACHVTEVMIDDKQVLIDGGVSHFNFGAFMADLVAALQATRDDPAKFARFAARVLGADVSPDDTARLHARFRLMTQTRENWALRNAGTIVPGPGRVDALNVILNQVTAEMLHRPDNARPTDAPVSYPFLWDAPYLDFVQYNGVVPNAGAGAIGRNVGQVLGVFGEVSIVETLLPIGYASSVRVGHLMDLERTLESLTSPQWSGLAELGLLPPLDAALVARGQEIYAADCASCHAVINRTDRGALAGIPVKLVPLSAVGTDPAAAFDFSNREVATGPLQGRKAAFVSGDRLCARTHGNAILAHVTVAVMMNDLGATGGTIVDEVGTELETSVLSHVRTALQAVGEKLGLTTHSDRKNQESDAQVIARLAAAGRTEAEITAVLTDRNEDKSVLYALLVADALDRPAEDVACLEVGETAQYRARPLNGVWATGPFLHNGSVPTLRALLQPAAERPGSFSIGASGFDPVNVGFEDAAGPDAIRLDTSLPGNGNMGHDYGTARPAADRDALLEYLKSL
ncbi:cytochrome c [Paracoccaceae bacterium Fryx2]|nr:cytochrome c [Paracoccaceae bacterium Fryx2]